MPQCHVCQSPSTALHTNACPPTHLPNTTAFPCTHASLHQHQLGLTTPASRPPCEELVPCRAVVRHHQPCPHPVTITHAHHSHKSSSPCAELPVKLVWGTTTHAPTPHHHPCPHPLTTTHVPTPYKQLTQWLTPCKALVHHHHRCLTVPTITHAPTPPSSTMPPALYKQLDLWRTPCKAGIRRCHPCPKPPHHHPCPQPATTSLRQPYTNNSPCKKLVPGEHVVRHLALVEAVPRQDATLQALAAVLHCPQHGVRVPGDQTLQKSGGVGWGGVGWGGKNKNGNMGVICREFRLA